MLEQEKNVATCYQDILIQKRDGKDVNMYQDNQKLPEHRGDHLPTCEGQAGIG